MSIDQIYEIVRIILQILLGVFVGYKWGKSTVKVDVLQKQITKLENTMNSQDKNTQIVKVYITPDKSFTKST